ETPARPPSSPRKRPQVSEPGSTPPAPPMKESLKVTEPECTVAYRNLSGRDLEVKVDGKPHRLPINRTVAIAVPRQFVWQVEEQPVQTESIPENKKVMEVVIR